MSRTNPQPDQEQAQEILHGLVSIPSPSMQERRASHWLAEQMGRLGLERTEVDSIGNAVGELGDPEADKVVVLLGHIDTVPGDSVRVYYYILAGSEESYWTRSVDYAVADTYGIVNLTGNVDIPVLSPWLTIVLLTIPGIILLLRVRPVSLI